MILGAGIYQVPLIKKAKEMGYTTIVVSIKGNYPGFPLADKVYYVDTRDKDQCLQIAKHEKINAVCTTGTDVAMPTLGFIVDNLHLSGPSYKSCCMASNKWLMKQSFQQYDVKSADFVKVQSLEECLCAAQKIGYPCVLKIVDSSGSRGISVVKDNEQLVETFQKIHNYTNEDYILVEEFLDGVDFGAQAIVYQGEVLKVIPHTTEVYCGDTNIPIGHTVPYMEPVDSTLEDVVKNEVINAIKSLQIDNAVVNADLMMVDGIPYVIEMGARCGATGIPEIDSLCCGFDMYQTIIGLALGKVDDIRLRNSSITGAATSLLILSHKQGRLIGYNTVSHSKLHEFKIDYQIGDQVDAFKTGPNRIGHLIVSETNLQDSIKLAKKLVDEVGLSIQTTA